MENNLNIPETEKNEVNKAASREKNTGKPGRKTIIMLAVTAFLNTVGMTIIMPVVPFIAQQYVHSQNDLAAVVGWLLSVYAICQFVAAPALGVLSDRYGRRPTLLLCLLGSAIGYALFGFGGALWVLFLSRIIDGLTGGNFSILFAYIADVSEPQERSKLFGLFGALSGIGVILGPAIGGFLARLGYAAPLYIAAAITFANIVWGYFNLPETLGKEHRTAQFNLGELNPLKQLFGVFTLRQLRWLLLASFLYALPFAALQSNFSVLIIGSLGWKADSIGMIFLIVGAMDILVQGVLVGRLLPIFGEIKLTIGGLLGVMLSYILLGSVAFIASPILLLAGVALFASCGGLVEPALRGLVSQAAGTGKQGIVQGSSQSIQSLAMIIGPIWGGELYAQFGHASPYWCGAVAILVGIFVTFLAIPTIKGNGANVEVSQS